MPNCPKCGCDWDKWHHMTSEGLNGYHCTNCGNHLCYLPKGVKPKLSDLEHELATAIINAESDAKRHAYYIKTLEQKILEAKEAKPQ